METLIFGGVFVGGMVLGFWLRGHMQAVADRAVQAAKDVIAKV